MKFCPPILLAVATLFLLAPIHAQVAAVDDASEQFFRGFLMKNDAEKMETEGNHAGALALYQKMQQIFDSVAQQSPEWQPGMISNRRALNQQAIARLQAKLSQPAVTTPAVGAATSAPAATMPIFGGGAAAPIPTPGTVAAPAAAGTLPSLSETLAQWEQAYRQRMTQLEAQNSQMQVDLTKWQQWYQWASGEISTARADKQALEGKTAKLEESIAAMKIEVAAGRATQQQLDVLTKEKIGIEVEYKKVVQRIAAAESASKEASNKLADASTRITQVEMERNKILAERDTAIKERDAAKQASEENSKKTESLSKERDTLSAQNLGMKTELESLKKQKPSAATAEMKKLLAENDRLKGELEAAQKQVVTLKADNTRKDQEITNLRGQLTTLQTEMADLRKQSSTYQTQVAELTLQLKNLQEARPGMTPELAQENNTLREIIMRQLRTQYRQQQAKDLVIAELRKMEGVSTKLLEQVEDLKSNRLTLTADEEKLFTDPAVREMLGSSGIQGTLIARVSKPDTTKTANPVDALITKANDAFGAQNFSQASTLYEDALRADPKNTTALVGLGYSREREKKYPEAEAALKKCLLYDAQNEMASFHLGVTYFKQDRWNDAMSAFEKNLVSNPKNARGRHYLGIIATKLNFIDRAEREFKTALAIDPTYGEAHFNLAVLYATWDPPQWDKAKAEYEQAIKKGVSPDANLEKLLKGTESKPEAAR
jgi:tetratricopeptide (TPR) repeat protein